MPSTYLLNASDKFQQTEHISVSVALFKAVEMLFSVPKKIASTIHLNVNCTSDFLMFYSNKKSQQWCCYIIFILTDFELDPFSRSGCQDGISVNIFLVKYLGKSP